MVHFKQQPVIAVIGLGYVGLPVAMAFAAQYEVIGFDINLQRVHQLNAGLDTTGYASSSEILQHVSAGSLVFTDRNEKLASADIYIITVPTPVDDFYVPDLTPLKTASHTAGAFLQQDNIIIYESTVYPGCTEEICVPELEKASGLIFNQDFYVGYSPERINPGDSGHPIGQVRKITSGSTPEAAIYIDQLYQRVLEAATYPAVSIKVAEAAKVIENAQRDVNISFMNELALIFDRMDIDTRDVLAAAATKWNFLPFEPGLVGGHCIGVDPYYLAYKAEALGYFPQVILSGRRVNNGMGAFVASKTLKLLIENGHRIKGCRVLILGITFKENIPDIRNTRVVDLYRELKEYGLDVAVYDPVAAADQVAQVYGIPLLKQLPDHAHYEAVILAVKHTSFKELHPQQLTVDNAVIFDIKGFWPREWVTARL